MARNTTGKRTSESQKKNKATLFFFSKKKDTINYETETEQNDNKTISKYQTKINNSDDSDGADKSNEYVDLFSDTD